MIAQPQYKQLQPQPQQNPPQLHQYSTTQQPKTLPQKGEPIMHNKSKSVNIQQRLEDTGGTQVPFSPQAKIMRDADTSRFAKRIGSVTYEVGIHFKSDAKETMDKKIMRLIKNDMAYAATQSTTHTTAAIATHEIHKINSEIKQTKARIRKVKDWLYKHPIHNPPSITDIYGGIAKGKNLKNDWQKVRSIQTQAKVLIFLQENNINSLEDFADTVVRKNGRLKDVIDDIKKAERRLETLAVHLTHADNNRRHKAVYQKYKSLAPKTDPAALNSINPFTKSKATREHEAATKKQDEYYTKYADAIQAHQAAQTYFVGVMNGRTKLPIVDWQKEQKELAAKRYTLCDEYYSLKEEIPNMEAIRRSIETIMRDKPNRAQPTRSQSKAL